MKAGDDVESCPWCAFNDVAINRSNAASRFRQFRIRLDATGVKTLLRHAEEVASGATNLEQSPGTLKLPDQIQPPFGIQCRKPLFFVQTKAAKVAVRLAYFCRRFFRRDLAENEL